MAAAGGLAVDGISGKITAEQINAAKQKKMRNRFPRAVILSPCARMPEEVDALALELPPEKIGETIFDWTSIVAEIANPSQGFCVMALGAKLRLFG